MTTPAITLHPISNVNGIVNLPGSKSLSNRALLLAALAKGKTTLTNLLDSDDVRHMLNALKQLGVSYTLSACRTQVEIEGLADCFSTTECQEIYLGNAGTAMRPLCAVLAMSQGEFTLTGEPRMEERPINHLIDALLSLGASVNYLKTEGFPPVQIKGKRLNGGEVEIDGSISSQFLTALLISAPLIDGDLTINIKGELVSKPYIDITLDTMKRFGVDIVNHDYQSFFIPADAQYISPGRFMVEGDASSASYFLAAAAIKGGTIRVNGVGRSSIQGDIRFADVLEKMGAKIEWDDESITASAGKLKAIDMDMNHIPDAAMTIATTALFADGTTTIRNVYSWRVKETDRLAAMATELRKVGAKVEEGEDYISITPRKQLKHAAIDTYNDHRMAMCFSLVALSNTAVTINDPGCTSKTFPDYFQVFSGLCV